MVTVATAAAAVAATAAADLGAPGLAVKGRTDWVGLEARLTNWGAVLPTGLLLGEAGGVLPWGCRVAGGRVVGGALRVSRGLGSCDVGRAGLVSAALVGWGLLEAGSGLEAAVALGGSGLVVLVVVDVTGFLAAVVVAGLLTSFLAGPVGLGACAVVVLPVEGAVVPTLEAAGLLEPAAAGLDVPINNPV